MSLAADEAGSIGTVGSNCEEDWVEIEGITVFVLLLTSKKEKLM